MNNNLFKVDIINLINSELNSRINAENTEVLSDINSYINLNKNNCLRYIYETNRYKDSALIISNTLDNLVVDFCKDVSNLLMNKKIKEHLKFNFFD